MVSYFNFKVFDLVDRDCTGSFSADTYWSQYIIPITEIGIKSEGGIFQFFLIEYGTNIIRRSQDYRFFSCWKCKNLCWYWCGSLIHKISWVKKIQEFTALLDGNLNLFMTSDCGSHIIQSILHLVVFGQCLNGAFTQPTLCSVESAFGQWTE